MLLFTSSSILEAKEEVGSTKNFLRHCSLTDEQYLFFFKYSLRTKYFHKCIKGNVTTSWVDIQWDLPEIKKMFVKK